jgi:hypothetical protein
MTEPTPLEMLDDLVRIGDRSMPEYSAIRAALASIPSLQQRIAELEAWRVAIAEGTGFINRAEEQSGYEIADPQTIINHFQKLGYLQEELLASQAEAGRLAEALKKYTHHKWSCSMFNPSPREMETAKCNCHARLANEVLASSTTALSWLQEHDRALQKQADDLAALVRQLAYSLGKAAPNHGLPARAVDYLKRKNLQGSILREWYTEGETSQEQP